jgi:DNA-dependent protein kinase catalytic subunit
VEDTISHLPSFIASFANILLELNEVDDVYVDHLENVIGTFFLVYPQLYDVKRWSYYMAISRLFVALYSKGSALQNLLSRIVFQGLTLTCSKPIVKQSAESSPSATQPAEYFTEYQDLWRNLLNPRIPDELEFPEHQRKDLCKIIYNEFMQSIIRMVQKLVLQYNVVKESAQGEEKGEDKEAELLATSEVNPNLLKPVVPKDFELFLNLVNFCKMILPQIHQELFEKWIYIFAKEVIIKSNQFPLVSGFYKLLGVTLKVSDQLKYFEQMDEAAAPELDAMTDIDDEPASAVTNMDLQTKRVCFTLISKFIQEVETRMKQYKDELLASCLSLVLSVPKAFVTIADKVSSLQLCLKLGESYWPLACVALDALEQWTKSLAAQLRPHLSRILPSFNSYLKATTSSVIYVQAQSGQQSTLQRIEGTSALTADGEDDKKLKSEIQLRMLRLLAQLGGDNVNLIQDVDLATSSSEASIAWDTVKRVKFVVPFQDVKPDVWLDDLLPRIVELAEEASDRQTKVAACELLHSVVLYMIGSNAKLEPVPVYKIYARLFPAMIRLAVDVEQVTRQLFEPLMMQVIHWFTKNQTEENTETMTLLDSIIECVASPSDGAVREFSAKCLTEFLKWSIKQSSKKQQEKNPFNAKSLFKRVYSLMHHPNPYKRMGAYLTVKSLYRVFREEQALVDQFVLELSHSLLFSMRLAQHDDTSLGTARLALSVLEALTRIIERHVSTLSKPNSARRAHADLNAFLSWVLSQTARSERVVRRAAQGLIARLTAPSSAAWVQKHVLPRRPLNTLIALFEGGVEYEEDEQEVPQRAVISPKDALPSLPDLASVLTWLSRVQASLDLWTWAFSTNMLAPGDVLAAKNGSRLMQWCAHFLTHYQLRSVVTDENSAHFYLFRPLTPLEIDQFFTQQCSILHLYFKLLHVLLDKHKQASMDILVPSFNEAFFKLFFTSILAPEQLGFVANKLSQQKKMMALTCNLCRVFTQVLPKSAAELMKKVLRHMLNQPEMNLLTLDFKHSNLDVERARCLVQGYAQLHACELLMDSLPKNTNLTEHLLVQAFDHSDNYTPLEMSVGGLTLQLTFSLHPSEKHLHALIAALIKLLLDETLVEDRSQPSLEELQSSVRASQRNENDEGDNNVPNMDSLTVNAKKSTKGEVFYKNFREQIDDFIANNMQYFVKPIMTQIHKNYLMFRVLLNVVDRQVRHRNANSKAVVQLVVAHLSQLNAWVKLESTQEQKESVLELLKRVMHVSSSAECVAFAREVLCAFTSRAMPLLFKTDVLDLLPALLTAQNMTEQHKKQIRERVRELITYDFPVQSTDLPHDSAVYNEYISCLNKLMHVLVQTGDLMLLEELYPIFRERRHRHMSHLEQQLSLFVKALKHRAEHAVQCFNMIMTVVADPTMTAWLKYNLTRHVLLPLYELLPLNHQIQVMQQQIHYLVKTINIEELDNKSSQGAKQSQSSADDSELTAADVVDRICAFNMIQAMYQCLPSNAIREKINKAYYSKSDAKGNELTTTIMRASHYIKSQQLSVTSSSVFNEGVTRELLLEYQGTAFNTLAAVVICTQSKENFFTVFCFKENAAKHEYLWENIVDTDRLCQFEVETNFPVAHKEVTSLLSKFRAKEDAQDKQANLRYISSQYLADSSLSQDISNTSFFGKENEDNEPKDVADKPREDAAANTTGTSGEETGEMIELDPINSNPCMLSLLRLIDHLQKQFGATYSKDEMPKWMKELHLKCAAPGI